MRTDGQTDGWADGQMVPSLPSWTVVIATVWGSSLWAWTDIRKSDHLLKNMVTVTTIFFSSTVLQFFFLSAIQCNADRPTDGQQTDGRTDGQRDRWSLVCLSVRLSVHPSVPYGRSARSLCPV